MSLLHAVIVIGVVKNRNIPNRTAFKPFAFGLLQTESPDIDNKSPECHSTMVSFPRLITLTFHRVMLPTGNHKDKQTNKQKNIK